MKAVVKVKRGKGNIELREVKEPTPGSDEVKIEIKAAGICGTDIHICYDSYPSDPPVTLGHEFCGVITEVGKDVKKLKPGDRVMAEPAARICGGCVYCRTGRYNMCSERLAYGVNLNGGFTKYIVVREKVVHRLPDNVSFIAGALTEPLACCVHAIIERVKVSAGDIIVVLGPGPVGLLAAQVAKAAGATVIICGTSRDKRRLSLASRIGIDFTVNIDTRDLGKIVSKLTGGYGADMVVEAAGTVSSVRESLGLVKRDGVIIQLGLFESSIKVDYNKVVFKELKIIGSFAHQWTSFEKALELLKTGKVNAEALVSEKLPITRWRKAFKDVEEKRGGKVILIPTD